MISIQIVEWFLIGFGLSNKTKEETFENSGSTKSQSYLRIRNI